MEALVSPQVPRRLVAPGEAEPVGGGGSPGSQKLGVLRGLPEFLRMGVGQLLGNVMATSPHP